MRKKLAIFTIVQNEDFHLPMWFKYYSGFVHPNDIYILNHETSTETGVKFLEELKSKGVNVINIVNEKSFDHDWLARVGSDFQNKLIKSYEITICADADEYLVLEEGSESKVGLIEHIESKIKKDKVIILRAEGFSVEHFFNSRGKNLRIDTLDTGVSILAQRRFYRKSPEYNKPAISSVPCRWGRGFHNVFIPSKDNLNHIHFEMAKSLEQRSGVLLFHTHKIDYFECRDKHEKQARRNWANDGGGAHNKIHGEEFDDWFEHSLCPGDGKLTLIPSKYINLF